MLVSTTALGDEVITMSPHVSADMVYNHSDANFSLSIDIDAMAAMDTSSTDIHVTMTRYTLGYINATTTNTVLINGSSSNATTRALHLTITDWQFLAGGALKFIGHFAPGSTFDISNIRTSGIVPTTPILSNEMFLWGSSFALKDFTCSGLTTIDMTPLTALEGMPHDLVSQCADSDVELVPPTHLLDHK